MGGLGKGRAVSTTVHRLRGGFSISDTANPQTGMAKETSPFAGASVFGRCAVVLGAPVVRKVRDETHGTALVLEGRSL